MIFTGRFKYTNRQTLWINLRHDTHDEDKTLTGFDETFSILNYYDSEPEPYFFCINYHIKILV